MNADAAVTRQCRDHLPADWYRMHTGAKAHYWQQHLATCEINHGRKQS